MIKAKFPSQKCLALILNEVKMCSTPLINIGKPRVLRKTKGIEAKPMPSTWYNWISNKISKGKNSSEKKEFWFNRKLIADNKPYFMQYIYPAERTKLNQYIKNNNEKSIMRFRITLDELIAKENKTYEEQKFIDCYYNRMPLGIAPCTINKICWRIEELFDDTKWIDNTEFDYSILKSDVEYSNHLFNKIKKIYERYKKETSNYMKYAKSERLKSEDRQMQKYIFKDQFKRECFQQCPNEEILCNIVLDLCYSKSKVSKQFAWDICGDMIIQNLLKRNNYMITYPTLDESGNIEFNGQKFSMKTSEIKVNVDIETEENKCLLC